MAERRPLLAVTVTVSMIVCIYYTNQHAPPILELEPCPSSLQISISNVTAVLNVTAVAASCDPMHRSAFLLKVYGTTCLQLATSAVVACLVCMLLAPQDDDLPFTLGEPAPGDLRKAVISVLYTETFACFLTIITFALLSMLLINRKDSRLAFRYFEAFSVVTGIWLGLICAFVPKVIVAMAGALTLYMFGMLTIVSFAFVAVGVDFGFLQPVLVEILSIVVSGAILRLAFGLEKEALWAIGGMALWSAYIVFDSNRIARRYPTDEYVAGAMDLYLDVVNLFIEILELLLSTKSK